MGLSPRVRGNRVQRAEMDVGARSIPACAGEPAPLVGVVPRYGVYPRVCGGTAGQPRPNQRSKGLSPRVRGNLFAGAGCARRIRSIPACAGEPQAGPDPGGVRKVYPRVCGGTVFAQRFQLIGQGLSPRVRGNPAQLPLQRPLPRSIPACAGEPGRRTAADSWPGVYPRVCGGTFSGRFGAWPVRGLSPRVRGNPYPARSFAALERSIPACAGEPAPAPAIRGL